MTGAETPNTTPESSKNSPAMKSLDIQEKGKIIAVEKGKPEEIKQIVDEKYPNAKEINDNIKTESMYQAALEEAKQKLDISVDTIAQNPDQFKKIVTFMSYFQLPKNGSTIKIVNCPELQKTGKDKISDSSINDTNPEQKREIVKGFLAISPELVKEYIPGVNELHKGHPIDMDDLAEKATLYQQQQKNIALIVLEIKKVKVPESEDTTMILAKNPDSQVIGKLFQLAPEYKTKIMTEVNNLKGKYQTYSVDEITLQGDADATPVTETGKKLISENFTKHLNFLKEKGFDTSKFPDSYENFGKRLADNKYIQEQDSQNIDIVSNRGFAFTRAMMQLSWMSPEQAKDFSDAKINLKISVNKERGDDKTKGGIALNGSGTRKAEGTPEKFTSTIYPEASEVIIENDVRFAVKIGNDIKIFRFSKQDTISPTGEVKTINTFAKMTDEGSLGTHGNEKNTLDTMGDTKNKYSEADFGGPVFFINIPDAQQGSNPIIDKIKNSKNNQDTSVSVNELLSLYKSVGGSSTETAKIEKTYSVGNI